VPFVASCRVDADVEVTVDEDGSGELVVTVVADAELVREAPDLAEDVSIDDLVANGWEVDGPASTDDGGLRLVLEHSFTSPEEASALLESLGGPVQEMTIDQTRSFARLATNVDGTLLAADGISSFSDAALLETLGGPPLEATLAERGLGLADVFGFEITIGVPGDVTESNGLPVEVPEGAAASWTGDFLGAAATPPGQALTMHATLVNATAQRADRIAGFAPWALAAWCVFVVGVALPIRALMRRRKAAR
jgi:hypothetical protein